MFRLSQPRDLVVNLLAGNFSVAEACLTALVPWMLVGCESDPNCFHLAKDVSLKKFGNAALDAGIALSFTRRESQGSLSGARVGARGGGGCPTLVTAEWTAAVSLL